MGASREMTIAALAEPALMLGLFTSALVARLAEPGRRWCAPPSCAGPRSIPASFSRWPALFIILIAETGRIPVDNPATHLELTMIHEAMVLEYAGPDLALVEWASALKELLFMTVLVNLFLPLGIAMSVTPADLGLAVAVYAGKVFLLAVAVTLVESTNAKLRLFRVPELMAVSLGLGFLALAIRFL